MVSQHVPILELLLMTVAIRVMSLWTATMVYVILNNAWTLFMCIYIYIYVCIYAQVIYYTLCVTLQLISLYRYKTS